MKPKGMGVKARTNVGGALVALGFVALVSVGSAGVARADTVSVPYNDLAAQGSITLCDATGHAVTGGSIYDKPFVWRAISNQPATSPYDKQGRTAVLLAYQPQQKQYPDQWNGDTLTGATQYQDPKFPTAVGTLLDFSLADYLHEYPTRWNGLVQLRMYLGVPGAPTFNTPYPTAEVQVTGDRWSLVRGGGAACTTTPAESTEQTIAHLNVSATPTAALPGGGSYSSTRGAGGPTAAAPLGVGGQNTAGAAVALPASTAVKSGSSAIGKGWIAALVVVVIGAIGLFFLRRNGATGKRT